MRYSRRTKYKRRISFNARTANKAVNVLMATWRELKKHEKGAMSFFGINFLSNEIYIGGPGIEK